MPHVSWRLNLHAFRNVVLPVLGPQCIITAGRRRGLLLLFEAILIILPSFGSLDIGVAKSHRSVYCAVRFHDLAMVPQGICAVSFVADCNRYIGRSAADVDC